MIRADVAIVGAGMAGASLAAEIAQRASVILIEGEDQPGYHATGRSAAFWSESYGGPGVQPLTRASGDWLKRPPRDFADATFLHRRGGIHIADAQGMPALRQLEQEFPAGRPSFQRLDRASLETYLPRLQPGWDNGLLEAGTADIDVAALHAAYIRAARLARVRILLGARVRSAVRARGVWRIEAGDEVIAAPVLVDAAGAWADGLAEMAGVAPIGIQAYRRTVAQLRVDPPPPATMPLVIDAGGKFYFKPAQDGRLWLSPHDETAAAAGDLAAEEVDVALAINRLEHVVGWRVLRVERAWAGLRSFAPDRLPIYGFDAAAPGFFWFAGQGGFGIQTAPAAAKIGAALLLGGSLEPMIADIDVERYHPRRFTA